MGIVAMNPGPMEEAGKAASGVIDALKVQPTLLVMAIVNVLLVVLVFYVAQGAGKTREREVAAVYEQSRYVAELLSRCVVAPANTP